MWINVWFWGSKDVFLFLNRILMLVWTMSVELDFDVVSAWFLYPQSIFLSSILSVLSVG